MKFVRRRTNDRLGYLKLPTRFESKHRCTTVFAWDEEAIDLEERRLKTFGFSGQHQQEPVPKGGGQFQRKWFKIEDGLRVRAIGCPLTIGCPRVRLSSLRLCAYPP